MEAFINSNAVDFTLRRFVNSFRRGLSVTETFIERKTMTHYESSTRRRQNSDCAVYALSKVLEIEYGVARTMMFHYGWSSTRGAYMAFLIRAIEDHGGEVIVAKQSGKVCEIQMDRGIVEVSQHVMPIVDGVLENAKGFENWIVKNAYEVKLH